MRKPKRTARGQPRLVKRADSPTWCIYIPKSGNIPKQRLSTGTEDYQQAEQIFAQWLIERKRPELAPLDQIRVIDVLIRYEQARQKDITVIANCKPLKSYYKNYVVSQVTNQVNRDYVIWRTAQKVTRGKGVGDKFVRPTTARRELETLSAAFGYCHREGYIKERPYIEKPRPAPPRDRWLTVDEFGRLLAASDRLYLRAFLWIAISTSARPSSILELQWFQVDFENRLIHFNPPGRDQTKKYRPSVYINDALLPILKEMRENATSEYVMAYKNGKPVRSIKKGFKQACTRAKIKDATPYTLRHTAITWAIQGGESLIRAGQMAGHKEPRTTMRYSKHDPSFTKDTVDILSTGAKLAQKVAENIRNQQKPIKKSKKKQ